MSVLDRKLRRELLASRGAIASILLVMIIGIACFVGLASSYENLTRARAQYFAQCRMADFWVQLKRAPLAALDDVREIPGVMEVQPRIVFDATVDLPNVPRPLSAQIISLPERAAGTINGIMLRRGGYFTDRRMDEVMVNDAFARARNIHPGQRIGIVLNNRRHDLFVVGTAVSSEHIYLMSPGSLAPDSEHYGVCYVKRRFAEETLDFDGACNQLVGRLTAEARANPDPILDRIELMLDDYGVFAATPQADQASTRFLDDEIKGLRVTAIIMPGIFLGVASLVLNILMTRTAEQQRVTIGTLKALGYTNSALMAHYLKFGVVVGILGSIGGVVAGCGLAVGMTAMYRFYFQLPMLENRLAIGVYGVALVISVAFAMLGTVRGVRAIVKLSPSVAMRAQPPAGGGAVPIEAYRRLWRSLGFRWQMALRSLWRHKWRASVGGVAATFGAALLLMTFYMSHAMTALVEFQFDKVLVSDMDIVFEDVASSDALREGRNLAGTWHTEAVFTLPCTISSGHRAKKTAITGIVDGATLTMPRTAEGDVIGIPETGLVMSRRLAEMLHVQPGQLVTITPIQGTRRPVQVPIARLTDSYLGLVTYANRTYLSRLVDEVDAVSSLQIKHDHDLGSRLALYRQIKHTPVVQAVNDNVQTRRNLITTMIDPMRISITAMIAFAAAIFLGSILTTSLVAVAERRREIATLIVMGYEPRHVGGVFLRESMVVNLIGGLIGLPVGWALILLMLDQYSNELYRMPQVSSPWSFLLTIVAAIVFTVGAHALVQRGINRMNWREAINAKE